MRYIELHPESQEILNRVSRENLVNLAAYVSVELEDAKAARKPIEFRWDEAGRLYEGVSDRPIVNVPIENAPNIEVPLGAIASDAIYAQVVDLLYNISPPVTTRPNNVDWNDHSKAFQQFLNFGVTNEFNLRAASENSILDTVQRGTGIYYIPWVEGILRQRNRLVRMASPRIYSVPVEDFFVPGGACDDLNDSRWVAMRTWLTRGEMAERAYAGGWDVRAASPAGKKSFVRTNRERLGGVAGQHGLSDLYEIFNIFLSFDIDGDGYDEDLFAIFDMTSRSLLKYGFTPFDRKPFSAMRYQLRAHLFYGIGVVEMLRSFQDEVTKLHNYRLANQLLANTRMYAIRSGLLGTRTGIYPGKFFELPNPKEDLIPIQMADVYASAPQAELIVIQLAERRVGLDSLSRPGPNLNRTPATTAISQIQLINRRFTPAFDGVRLGTADAVRQCAFRYQERVLAGDQAVMNHIVQVMGQKQGELVIRTLQTENFEDALGVEMTASSATLNRQIDRQEMLQFVTIMTQYYQGVLQLVQLSQAPDAPPLVKETALSIANKAGEIIDRAARTFDQVRDPNQLILEINESVAQSPDVSGAGLEQLLAGFAGAQPAPTNGNGLPVAA